MGRAVALAPSTLSAFFTGRRLISCGGSVALTFAKIEAGLRGEVIDSI